MYTYVNQLKDTYYATTTKCKNMSPETKDFFFLLFFTRDAFVSAHNRSKIYLGMYIVSVYINAAMCVKVLLFTSDTAIVRGA